MFAGQDAGICRTGFSREGGRSDDAIAANVPASSRLKPVLLYLPILQPLRHIKRRTRLDELVWGDFAVGVFVG